MGYGLNWSQQLREFFVTSLSLDDAPLQLFASRYEIMENVTRIKNRSYPHTTKAALRVLCLFMSIPSNFKLEEHLITLVFVWRQVNKKVLLKTWPGPSSDIWSCFTSLFENCLGLGLPCLRLRRPGNCPCVIHGASGIASFTESFRRSYYCPQKKDNICTYIYIYMTMIYIYIYT